MVVRAGRPLGILGQMCCLKREKVWGIPRRLETPVLPDEPDDSTQVMWWKELGQVNWRRVGECVGLIGGFSPWLHVRLLPKMVNKINAIEYSGEGALGHIEVCSKSGGTV